MRLNHWLLLLTLTLTGCAGLQDYKFREVQKQRAFCAWYCSDEAAVNGWYFSDYARGWRTGYYDVLMGSDGRLPPVPPPRYWHASYQTVEGQTKIDCWFAGYQDGAIAAQCDSGGEALVLPTSPTYCPPSSNTGPHPASMAVPVESTDDVLAPPTVPPAPTELPAAPGSDDGTGEGAKPQPEARRSRFRTATRPVDLPDLRPYDEE